MNVPIELTQRGLTENQIFEARDQVARWLHRYEPYARQVAAIRVEIAREGERGCPFRVDIELQTEPSRAVGVSRSALADDPHCSVGYAVRQALINLDRLIRPVLRSGRSSEDHRDGGLGRNRTDSRGGSALSA